jgi:hypothetical protein
VDSAAEPTHPSLIDSAHVTNELLGFVNVPSAIWINEAGQLVRPAELASIETKGDRPRQQLPGDLPERLRRTFQEVAKFQGAPERYLTAIHDWVQRGDASEYALDAEEVVARSAPRSVDEARAAACFELGQWHWSQNHPDEAVNWWRQAHNLHPQNWTYKRQAWTFATTKPGEPSDLLQGPNDTYEGNWLDDLVDQGGGETYYTPPDL